MAQSLRKIHNADMFFKNDITLVDVEMYDMSVPSQFKITAIASVVLKCLFPG